MKKLFIIILSIFILASCSDRASNIDTSTNDSSVGLIEFIDNDLPTPNNIINNNSELTYILDYMAFYKMDEIGYIKVSNSYFNSIRNIKYEVNLAKSNSIIADTYMVDFDIAKFKSQQLIGIDFFIKDIANDVSEGNIEPIKIKPISVNAIKYNEMLPLEKNNKGVVKCSSGEEIYYAASMGYLPEAIPGSRAEELLKEIDNVLSYTYSINNSAFNNIKNAYDYLTTWVSYDKVAAKSSDFDLEKNMAYFIDGVFLNRLATCDGKSKAYSLLLSYMGIENVRIKATNDRMQKHAYNYIKLDNMWYLSCTTWGSNIVDIEGRKYQVPSYNMLLTTKETPYGKSWGYTSDNYLDIEKELAKTPYKMGTILDNSDSIKNEINKLVGNELKVNSSIEILVTGLGDDDILAIIDSYDLIDYELLAIKNKVISNNLYSILLIEKGRTHEEK